MRSLDIRTKLVFAQVSVALVSMLALAFAMFSSVEEELNDAMRHRLDGLAELKVESVEQVVGGWHDRLSLVASRTQLRESLDGFLRTGSPIELERLERILDDAVSASPLFRSLSLRDRSGTLLVEATSPAGLAPPLVSVVPGPVDSVAPGGPGPRYDGLTFRRGTPPTVAFSAPLVLDGEELGHVHGVVIADEIVRLIGNHQGLGETGEVMVVVRDGAGSVRTLHPLRDAPPVGSGRSARPAPVSPEERPVVGVTVDSDGPAARAVAGVEAQLLEGLVDYRGQRVIAATRFVPETGWGIVVKMDEAEQRRPIDRVRRESVRVAVVFAAFAILFGTLLGYLFAQPIHKLAEAAERIRAGHLDTRSGITREDEVGLLARTFDEMAGALEDQVLLLSEFRRFFEASLDMMCIASTDGYFKKVNPAFVRELGWPEEELLRRPFVSMVHPEDVDATYAEIEKLASGVPTIRFKNRYLCMDGTYKALRWNAFPEENSDRLYAIARVQQSETPGAM